MKALVLSDSHRSLAGMLDAVDQEQPDQILHLGDLCSDAEELSFAFPRIPLVCVPGNCDGWTDRPEERLLSLGGHLILMAHGHRWRVKSGTDPARAAAVRCGAEVVLFGHTHHPLCRQEDGLWLFNPGSIRDSGSYGLLFLEPGSPVRCVLSSLSG